MAEQRTVVTEIDHPVTAPPKPIELNLAWYINDYKVLSITNTTWYKPGQWLAPQVVQRLCDLPGWTVNMADNDVISTLFGLGVGALSKAAVL